MWLRNAADTRALEPDFILRIPKTRTPGWFARLVPCHSSVGSDWLRLSPRGSLFLKTRLLFLELDCFKNSTSKLGSAQRLWYRGHRYMTNARFSSSFCSTGNAHPDISTRPTASKAACGESGTWTRSGVSRRSRNWRSRGGMSRTYLIYWIFLAA